MLFNSWVFVSLVLVTLLVYYLPIIRRYQIYVLLIASMVFYAYDSFWLLLLLLGSGLVNALASYGAYYYEKPRLYASLGVCLNLLLLASFKYGGMFSSCFFDVDSGIGHFLCTLPLPLGISFYTFSGISLVIDSYKGRLDKFENSEKTARIHFPTYLQDVLLYICFFPKLLAGPIAKSKTFFASIGMKYFRDIDWQFVFKSLVLGYFLKMVIADNLKDFTFWMPFRYSCYLGTGSLLTLVFGYSVQIFADFAGYSLIAIGVAAIFGYRLPNNFHFPYISSSFREFWKRWHITLSQFLMEYLYISLGGNRKGKVRTYINLLLTMTLGGLWHGAAWSFLVWGVFHGLCLVMERILCGRCENCISFGNNKKTFFLSHFLSILVVFTMVSFGWLLFKMSFGEAVHYIMAIFCNCRSNMPFFDMRFFPVLIYMLPVVLYHIVYLLRNQAWIQKNVLRFNYVIYGFMLFLLLVNSGSVSEFVYFQF